MRRELRHAMLALLSLAIAWPMTLAIDKWQNKPVVEPPIIDPATRNIVREAAMVVMNSWATDPGMYDDAQLLAAYVESGFDEQPVTADWVRDRFGPPTQYVHGEQWNLPTGRASLFVKIEPSGNVVVWQRALILDSPTRGEMLKAMRAGGVEDYKGITE